MTNGTKEARKEYEHPMFLIGNDYIGYYRSFEENVIWIRFKSSCHTKTQTPKGK